MVIVSIVTKRMYCIVLRYDTLADEFYGERNVLYKRIYFRGSCFIVVNVLFFAFHVACRFEKHENCIGRASLCK